MRYLIIAFRQKLDKKRAARKLQFLNKEEIKEVVDESIAEARKTQASYLPTTASAVYALTTASVFCI
jgi:hypothetical protein